MVSHESRGLKGQLWQNMAEKVFALLASITDYCYCI